MLSLLYYTFIKYIIRFQIKFHPFRLWSGSNWYKHWIEKNENYDMNVVRSECDHFQIKPLMSIVLPVYNVQEEYLRECIESVQRQYYTNWQLCIADDCSTMPHIKVILEEYRKKNPKILVTYRSENGHISACSNTALEMVTGEYVVLLDNDDILADFALYEVVKVLNQYPNIDLLFSNEDKWLEDKRVQPFFKRKWGFQLLKHMNYICHLSVYRTSLIRRIKGFRIGYEGVQDWDLAIRAIQNKAKVFHIPKILYHWRISPTSTAGGEKQKNYIKEKQKMLIRNVENKLCEGDKVGY